MRIPLPIALVGMPGAGKTTIGQMLADALAVPFADSDDEIARQTGLNPAQIFERNGEAAFRALERAAIDRLLRGTPVVLATGGGAMIDAGSRALLLDRATTIWLDAPVEILALRLAVATDRPLLSGNLANRLAALKAERDPLYAQAHIRVDASGPPDTVAKAAMAALRAARPR